MTPNRRGVLFNGLICLNAFDDGGDPGFGRISPLAAPPDPGVGCKQRFKLGGSHQQPAAKNEVSCLDETKSFAETECVFSVNRLNLYLQLQPGKCMMLSEGRGLVALAEY